MGVLVDFSWPWSWLGPWRRARRSLGAGAAGPLAGLVLVLAGLLFTAGPAAAQRGIDIETFRPTFDGYGLFTVERAVTGKQWDVGFKLWSDYAHTPLSLRIQDRAGGAGARSRDLDYQVAAHLGAHLSLATGSSSPWWCRSRRSATRRRMARTRRAGGWVAGGGGCAPATGFYVADARTNVPPPMPRRSTRGWRSSSPPGGSGRWGSGSSSAAPSPSATTRPSSATAVSPSARWASSTSRRFAASWRRSMSATCCAGRRWCWIPMTSRSGALRPGVRSAPAPPPCSSSMTS